MAEINLSPHTAAYEAMLRRRKLAEAMMQQGQQDLPTNQMAGGYVLPVSPYAGLGKMLQAGMGGYMSNKADQEIKDLALKREGDQKSDMTTLMAAMLGTAPGTPAMNDIGKSNQSLDMFDPTPAKPGTGLLAPGFAEGLKTPEARNQALALALQLGGPKTPIKVSDNESLIHPTTYEVLRQGQPKPEFGQPQYEMIDGVEHAVVYDKQGNRKVVGPATRQNQFNTGTVDARLNREQAQRQWDNMSASQRADYDIRGRQLGISGAQLFFETGMQPPGSPLPAPPGQPGKNPAASAAPDPSQPLQKLPPQLGYPAGAYEKIIRPDDQSSQLQKLPGQPQARTGTTLDLNNPGGLRPVGASTGFQRFDTPEAGLQGVTQNLRAYGQRGINTIEKIVSTWAPSNENDTKSYIAHVSRMLGIPANQPLDMNNPYVLQGLTTAIITKEQGPRLFASGGGGQTALSPKNQQALEVESRKGGRFGPPQEVTGPDGRPMLVVQDKRTGLLHDANTQQPVSVAGPKLGETALKQQTGVRNTVNAIREYRQALQNFSPGDIVKPDARARMGTLYNNMLLQAKEAFNLGVLNGPDYSILQEVITSPTTWKGGITSKEALNDQASQLARIMSEIEKTIVNAQSGRNSNSFGDPPPGAVRRINK